MTEGLITRIGRWVDHRWESKATESFVHSIFNSLENALINDRVELNNKLLNLQVIINGMKESMTARDVLCDGHGNIVRKLSERIDLLRTTEGVEKEVAELKTRMEKIELYAGMTRKVDPTKPPIAKSAFQM